VWNSLSTPWQTAFEAAWESWQEGSFGIGAVLVDPSSMEIVTTGHNRVASSTPLPGRLNGNMTAHAEMNAFSALGQFNAEGLHLYTTLEPCLMCIATAMQLKVDSIHFAAHDEFYDGLDQLWQHHEVTASRQCTMIGPFSGDTSRLGHFARLLPLTFTLTHFPGRSAEQLARHRHRHPDLAALADRMAKRRADFAVLRAGPMVEAVASLWEHLPKEGTDAPTHR
jgi:tRNA(Arg) A34 adenosine deaminase TadA